MPDVVTATGTRLYIGPAVDSTVDTAAEFTALTWTEVGMIETYGEIGDEAGAVTITLVNDARTRKGKGARDAGDFTVTVAHAPDDPGQIALEAAEGTNRNYAFRLVLPDRLNDTGTDTIQYWRGLVMSRRRAIGGADAIIRRTYVIAINSEVIEVVATAGAPPA